MQAARAHECSHDINMTSGLPHATPNSVHRLDCHHQCTSGRCGLKRDFVNIYCLKLGRVTKYLPESDLSVCTVVLALSKTNTNKNAKTALAGNLCMVSNGERMGHAGREQRGRRGRCTYAAGGSHNVIPGGGDGGVVYGWSDLGPVPRP